MESFAGRRGGSWRYDPNASFGQGGFGSVHPGEDATTRDPVAVKIIQKQTLGGLVMSTRLRDREAEIADKLEHAPSDHLIRVLDIGEIGASLCIVMELADRSLADALKEGLTDDEVLSAVLHVSAGLNELHQAGVIHRDLKPHNVLQVAGKWKLADFGIARDADLGTQTQTFLGAGTLAYMAPELFKLQSPNVKSDLYALGCVAYELLVGNPPFAGPDLTSFARQHESETPPQLPPGTNPALEYLVMRLLLKDPLERPQDARAVLERLQRVALPLSPGQLEIQRLAAQHGRERIESQARYAADAARRQAEVDLVMQAEADLAEILGDAAAMLEAALPEVELIERGPPDSKSSWWLRSEAVTLQVETWPGLPKSSIDPDDPIIVAGEVVAISRRMSAGSLPILANAVAEIDGGRVVWKLYRFQASGLAREYEHGPRDRPHGLRERSFSDELERSYMHRSVTHVWSLTKLSFTDEALVELFREALELPNINSS